VTALLVLHDVGEGGAGGGRPWAEAFRSAGWGEDDGPILGPDLPGHAGAPAPEGGNYEPGDGAFVAIRAVAAAGLDEGTALTVLGVGVNGWNAQLHGLAGRAAAVVLVDGLGGPWRSVRDDVLAGVTWLRGIADDPAAVAPLTPGAPLDPRLRHGLPSHGSRRMAFEAAAAMPVPVVVVESPGSGTPPEDAEALVAAMAGAAGAVLVRVEDPSPATVAPATLAALSQFRRP
jgi:hypothetical protein